MPKLFSNTSSLVASQLPDYIRGDYVSYVAGNDSATSDYSKFINFVEAYYKFLEKETNPTEVLQNAKAYSDVELTIDNANVSLVESFYKNYGYDIPRNLITNKKSFVKFFKDIYKTKGSEEAAKLLFRVLYNSDIEFTYPGNYILKASDGEWEISKSILVAPVGNTNVYAFKNTLITGEVSKATAKVKDVLKLTNVQKFYGFNSEIDEGNDYFELYLEDVRGNFRNENLVSSYSSDYKANTRYRLNKIDIIDGSAGYTLNESVTHQNAVLKIDKVNSFGKIQKISVVDSGIFYLNRNESNSHTRSFITVNIDPPSRILSGNVVIAGRIGTLTTTTEHSLHKNDSIRLSFFGNTLSSVNNTQNTVTITRVLDNKRVKFNLNIFANTNIKANVQIATSANLVANLGILKEEEGIYQNSRGRLSDNYYIQGALPNSPDSSILYYQPFSYVIESEQPTSKWKEIVKTTVHPSGTEVFGDVTINRNLGITVVDTGKSEIQKHLAFTADYADSAVLADSTSYYYPALGITVSINADHVIFIFGYL